MTTVLKMEIRPDEIIQAVKKMKRREREEFLEDLIASTSPEYLNSIKEARADYKAGRVRLLPCTLYLAPFALPFILDANDLWTFSTVFSRLFTNNSIRCRI